MHAKVAVGSLLVVLTGKAWHPCTGIMIVLLASLLVRF